LPLAVVEAAAGLPQEVTEVTPPWTVITQHTSAATEVKEVKQTGVVDEVPKAPCIGQSS
jgi:hypothetical protein